MALLHSTGFDIFANITEFMETGWSISSAVDTLSTSNGRFGGGCLESTVTTAASGFSSTANTAIDAAFHIAFAYYHSGGSSSNELFAMQSFTGQDGASVLLTAAGAVQARNRSNTVVETSVGSPVTSGAWHWIEIKIICGSLSNNGHIVVRVNGATVLNQTTIDTRPGGVAQIVGIFKISAPNATSGALLRVDDLFVMDTSGSVFNGFMDDRRIQTLLPTADSATVNWTASSGTDVSCVDDALGASNGDTDYISSATAAQESRFAMGNMTVSPASVDAVVLKFRARKDDAGNRTMRGLVNSSGSEAVGTTVGLSTAYLWKSSDAFLTDPNGAVAWTETTVNALEAGVEIVA